MPRLNRAALVVLLATAPLAATSAQGLGELAARARADSNDAQLHYQVAMGFWREKKWDEAEHYLRQAVQVAPLYAEALFAIGELPYARGQGYWKRFEKQRGHAALDSALDVYASAGRRAFLVNPLVGLELLGELKGGDRVNYGPFTIRSRWIGVFRRGATQLHRGNAEAAFVILDSARRDPYFQSLHEDVPAVVLWYHGLAAARIRNWDAAIEDFGILTGRGVKMERDGLDDSGFSRFRTNDYRYGLATMLFLAGRHAQAAPVFRRVLEVDLGVFPAHVQLARIYEAAGDAAAGIREREQAVATFPQDGTLHLELGLALSRAGRVDGAISALEEGERANPRDYRIPLVLGELLMAAGRDREARLPYERFLALAPLRLKEQMADVRVTLAQIQ